MWRAGAGHDTKPRRITTTERELIHSSLMRTPRMKRVTSDRAGLLARGSMPVTAFPNLFPGPVAIVVPARRIQLRGQPRFDACCAGVSAVPLMATPKPAGKHPASRDGAIDALSVNKRLKLMRPGGQSGCRPILFRFRQRTISRKRPEPALPFQTRARAGRSLRATGPASLRRTCRKAP